MFEHFRDKIPVTDAQWSAAISRFKRREVPARTVLLKEGTVSRTAFIIEQGCARAWFNQDGRDITCRFLFERQMVASIESFRKGIPSLVAVETIEPCTIWAVSKADLDVILNEAMLIPGLGSLLLNAVFERTYDYMKHLLSFLKDTPQQRYLRLVQESPYLIQRVPQHYIASYLGITPVHLSRIKGKLAKK